MRILLILIAIALLASCSGKSTKNGAKSAVDGVAIMKFESESADFGEVKEGEQVILFYTFENKGGKDLIIFEAVPSCGCAQPKYDSAPVKPGEKRVVEVTFDSNGWSGHQQKSVTFKTNGEPNYSTIYLSGTVN